MKNVRALAWDNPWGDRFLHTNNLWLPKGVHSPDFWNADGWYTKWEEKYMSDSDRQRMYNDLALSTAQCVDWTVSIQTRLLDPNWDVVHPRMFSHAFNNTWVDITEWQRLEAEINADIWRATEYDRWQGIYMESPVLAASRYHEWITWFKYCGIDTITWWVAKRKEYTLIVNLEPSDDEIIRGDWEMVFWEGVRTQIQDVLAIPKAQTWNGIYRSNLDGFMNPENREQMYRELEQIGSWKIFSRLECENSGDALILKAYDHWEKSSRMRFVGSWKPTQTFDKNMKVNYSEKPDNVSFIESPYDAIHREIESDSSVSISNTKWWVCFDRVEERVSSEWHMEYVVVFTAPPEVLRHIAWESESESLLLLESPDRFDGVFLPMDNALYQELRWVWSNIIIPESIKTLPEYKEGKFSNGNELEFKLYEIVYTYINNRLWYFYRNSRELKAGDKQLRKLTDHLNRVIQEELSWTIFEWFEYTSSQYVDIAMAIRKWRVLTSRR